MLKWNIGCRVICRHMVDTNAQSVVIRPLLGNWTNARNAKAKCIPSMLVMYICQSMLRMLNNRRARFFLVCFYICIILLIYSKISDMFLLEMFLSDKFLLDIFCHLVFILKYKIHNINVYAITCKLRNVNTI